MKLDEQTILKLLTQHELDSLKDALTRKVSLMAAGQSGTFVYLTNHEIQMLTRIIKKTHRKFHMTELLILAVGAGVFVHLYKRDKKAKDESKEPIETNEEK